MNIDKYTRGKEYKSISEINNSYSLLQDYMVKCKCSHTILFTGKKDRIICSHCGYYVYKDKKTKLKYKLKECLK